MSTSDGRTRYADDATLAHLAALETERDRLREALVAADAAMEHMGNTLSDMDAVTEEDEKFFPAFEQVRAALAGGDTRCHGDDIRADARRAAIEEVVAWLHDFDEWGDANHTYADTIERHFLTPKEGTDELPPRES